MDKETKTSLDNIVKKLQGAICIEKKAKIPNKPKMKYYLVSIDLINEEFKTNYSIKIDDYDITKIPLEE